MKNKRVLFATVVVLLWTVNSLDLQPYEFELRSIVAISKHRFPLLQSLCRDQTTKIELAGKTFDIRVISCDPFSTEASGKNAASRPHSEADLQTVKVRVRYEKYADVDSIEKWLESRTRPTGLSDRCKSIRSQLHAAQWRLESLEHTERIVIADRNRREEQIALQASESTSKFKLIGFQRSESPAHATQCIIDSIAINREQERQKIADLSNDLTRELAASHGFLQFSGSPKWFPVAESVGWQRGGAFIVLALAVWGVCRLVSLSLCNWSVATNSLLILYTRLSFRSFPIPNLGHAQLMLPKYASLQETRLPTDFSHEDKTRAITQSNISSETGSLGEFWLRACTTSCFATWVLIVLLRLVFDPAWRSLFVTAPLAAISKLISGVGL